MIGFVVAMEKEAKLFIENAQEVKSVLIAGKQSYIGKFKNKEFALIISGIGKVNAGFCTQILIDKYSPNYIVNFGVAGGKEGSDLFAGDVVLIDKVCQYDFDLSEIDEVNIGYMQDYNTTFYKTNYTAYSGNNFKICSCATGDRFTRKSYFLNVIKQLNAQVVDMESGAIAQVATANNIPFLCLKLISDVDGKEGSIFKQYQSNVKTVCDKIPNAIEELLNYLNM